MAFCLAGAGLPCSAQFLPSLQAKTPEEFDDYLLVAGAVEPKQVTKAAARFAERWPSSELAVRVFELQLEAYRKLGDARNALAAGERGLAAAADYLPLLAETAAIEANETSEAARLARAKGRAERALQLLASATAPRSLRPEEWEAATGRVASKAHAALGMVAFKRGETAAAIREFEEAMRLHPAPGDATQKYRLAMLYREAGRKAEARALLEQVVRSGEVVLERMAREALREF